MRFQVLFSLALAAVVVATGEVASSNEVEEISQELSQGLVEADFEVNCIHQRCLRLADEEISGEVKNYLLPSLY